MSIAFDIVLERLSSQRQGWANLEVARRIELLHEVRERIPAAADRWVALSNQAKELPPGHALEGEEWISGPWALLACCDDVLATLRAIAADGAPPIAALKKRDVCGQLAVEVFPRSTFDRLLLSGVRAEVWMEAGVTEATLPAHTAGAYRERHGAGELALVLGAGNIGSIAPLDAVHKLFSEKAVCIVKLNPVNDYLLPVFEEIFAPLIALDYLHFVGGGSEAGALLCNHALVDTIHITGSQETHDMIVYGAGEQGRQNRLAGRPANPRPISSELGAVCPIIVVPGPWSVADIRYQASHIATQKLHNSGFNCVAAQVLVLPAQWEHTSALRREVRRAMSDAPARKPYYPGAAQRQTAMAARHPDGERVSQHAQVIELPAAGADDVYACRTEVFAPTLCEQLMDASEPEDFLREAIAFANQRLRGTLGANILIHPATLEAMGPRFDALLQQLRYGCIAVNAWTGLGYLITRAPWGAFPGHTLSDVQSGIGTVHNALMFDRAQRTVVYAPFRPFPRSLLSGTPTLMPKPPWFVDNRRARQLGRRLFLFQIKPSWFKLPGIFLDALRG